MKCPYRSKTTIYKREMPKEALNKGDVVSTATQDFADCYEDECPFYNSYAENCGRVIQETGGEL